MYLIAYHRQICKGCTPFIVLLFNLTENIKISLCSNTKMTYAKAKDRTEREFSLEY